MIKIDRKLKLVIGILVITTISGCAGDLPKVALRPDFHFQEDKTIGVAIAKLPQPRAYKLDSQGMLDIDNNSVSLRLF